MDKLNTDQLILLIIAMKDKYQSQIKNLKTKLGALDNCLTDLNMELVSYDVCNDCDKSIYKILDGNDITDNYNECYFCGSKYCCDCLNNFNRDYFIVGSGKHCCDDCYNFEKKINEIK